MIKYTLDGSKLTIVVDLDGTKVTDSGNVLKASTHGYTKIPDTGDTVLKINMNIIEKP